MTRIPSTAYHQRTLLDLRRAMSQQARLQRQLASGKRIERPSDDPVAAARILPLRTDLRALARMQDNAATARSVLDLGAGALDQISQAMTRVREITLQAANTGRSGDDRNTLAAEVEQLLDQLVSLADTQRGGRFLFGGSVDGTAPFVRRDGDDGRTRVIYQGDSRERLVEVGPGVRMAVNLAGDALFLGGEGRGATVYSGDTGAAAGAPFDTGVGTARLEIRFAGLQIAAGTTGLRPGTGVTTALGKLDYVFTAPDGISINGGPTTKILGGSQQFPVGTAGDEISLDLTLPISPATGTLRADADATIDGGETFTRIDFTDANVIVEDSLDGSRLHVDVSRLTRTGTEEITFEGTFDPFTALVTVRDILRGNGGADDEAVRARLSEIVGAIEQAHDRVLTGLQTLGARSQGLDLLDSRLETLKLSDEESLSRLEDTDYVETIAALELQNLAYQSALQASARALQTSLFDFLR